MVEGWASYIETQLVDEGFTVYPNSLIAHAHVNWLSPVKLRSTLIGGSNRMVHYDDLAPSEKIKVYDKGVTVNGVLSEEGSRERALVDYRDSVDPQGRSLATTVVAHRKGDAG